MTDKALDELLAPIERRMWRTEIHGARNVVYKGEDNSEIQTIEDNITLLRVIARLRKENSRLKTDQSGVAGFRDSVELMRKDLNDAG